MNILTYAQLKLDVDMWMAIEEIDAAHRTLASGTHWMEPLYARYPSRPERGIFFYVYLRNLCDGEIYRLPVTARGAADYNDDRQFRLIPDGMLLKVEATLTKAGFNSAKFSPLYAPMGIGALDRLPAALVADWCACRTGSWYRIPCTRQTGPENNLEVLVIGYRSNLRIDDVDLINNRFGFRAVGDLARRLLDYKRTNKLWDIMPPDRAEKNEFHSLQRLLGGVDPRDAPMADDWIYEEEAIDYRDHPTAPALCNTTYTWLHSEPRAGGQRANRVITPLNSNKQAVYCVA